MVPALVGIGAPAQAQPGAAAPGPDLAVPAWTVEFRPSTWYVAPGGKLRLPGSAATAADMELSDITLDKPRLSPFVELHIMRGPWRFSLRSSATAGPRS